jgi:transcriptional regulator with XRE-family HTH domain
MEQGGFAARFRLALKAIGYSRGQAAAALGVDKSLVGRWASGAVRPSEHNVARVTGLVAARHPGFTAADWERDYGDFAGRLGIDARVAASMALPDAAAEGLPRDFIDLARAETARRGSSYEGFWQTTRPSVIMEGSLFHDHGMIRREANGLLQVRMGSAGLSFDGWALPAQGNLFAILYDGLGLTPLFSSSAAFRCPRCSASMGSSFSPRSTPRGPLRLFRSCSSESGTSPATGPPTTQPTLS